MIAMSVADQEDLGIVVGEAKLLDAFADQRNVLLEIGIDQDVSLWGVDQVDGKIGRADVIKIPGNLKCRKRSVPVRIALR